MLRFRVGPFPVSVYPWFFFSALLLGQDFGFGWKMLAWIFVVFVSVLVHELGHAVVGKLYGGAPEIKLEAFGGVTYPRLRAAPGPGKQFILSLAGPVFGLLLGGACWLLVHARPPGADSPSAWVMQQFIAVSVMWAVFNLLPILPLDGGQMMLAVVEAVRKKPSVALASWISFAVALAVAGLVLLFVGFDIFLIAWCALFAFQNFKRARAAAVPEPAPQGTGAPLLDPAEQADVAATTEEIRAAVVARDFDGASRSAQDLEHKGGAVRQAGGLRLRAGVELARGDNEAAALFAGQSFSLLPGADSAVVAARANLRAGQEERAKNWVRRALEAGAPLAAVHADPELGPLS